VLAFTVWRSLSCSFPIEEGQPWSVKKASPRRLAMTKELAAFVGIVLFLAGTGLLWWN
jgi:hypothetical protein